jgi:hypothetical protein
MPAENLKCKECGRTYPLQALFVCDYCFGPLEVTYDYDKIRRRAGAPPRIASVTGRRPSGVMPTSCLWTGAPKSTCRRASRR